MWLLSSVNFRLSKDNVGVEMCLGLCLVQNTEKSHRDENIFMKLLCSEIGTLLAIGHFISTSFHYPLTNDILLTCYIISVDCISTIAYFMKFLPTALNENRIRLVMLPYFKVYLYTKNIVFLYVKGTQFRRPLHQHSDKRVHQVMKQYLYSWIKINGSERSLEKTTAHLHCVQGFRSKV